MLGGDSDSVARKSPNSRRMGSTTEEWPAPSSPSAPYALAIDPNGRPTFFETAVQPNLLQTFDLAEVPRNWYDGVGLAAADPRRAVIEVVYSSIYGARWRIRSNSFAPEPVRD